MGIEELRKIKGLQKPTAKTFKQSQLEGLKQKVQTRQAGIQAEKQRILSLKSEASRLDNEIKQSNYLGSISNYENQLKTIPEEIRRYMTLSPTSAKSELQTRIKEVERLLTRAKEKEEKYDDRNDRPKEKQYRAEAKGYIEGLNKLKAGQFLSVRDIDRYADDLGDNARNKEKAKAKKKAAEKKAKPTLVTSYYFKKDPKTGDYKQFSKTVETTASFYAKAAKQQAQINYNKEIKKLNTQLGAFSNILNTADKKVLVNTQYQSSKAYNDLLAELRAIDKRANLNVIDKETLKRQKLGVYTGPKGEQAQSLGKLLEQNRKVQEKQLRDSLNTISPKIVNKQSYSKNVRNTLEELRQKAIKKDQNAKAAIIGLSKLPFAATEIVTDIYHGIKSLVNNPTAAAVAITSMTSSDISRAGINFGKRLTKGDDKALLEFTLTIAPLKFPKIDKFEKFLDFPKSPQAYKVKYDISQDIFKGSGSVKYVVDGITQAGESFKSNISLTLRPKDKTIFGKVSTTIAGKTKVRKLNLKDAGAFYVDRINKIKIPKQSLKLENIVSKTNMKSKYRYYEAENRLTATFQGRIRKGEFKKKKIIQVIGKKGVSAFEKEIIGKVEDARGYVNKKYLKDVRETAKSTKIKSSFSKSGTKKTPTDWDNINKWLEFIEYDKKIISGVDKRIRVAYTLGLNQKQTKAILKQMDNYIDDGYVVVRNKTTASGSFTKIKPARFSLGPSFALSKPIILKKLKKTKIGKTKLPQEIKLPELDSLVYFPKKLSAKIKIPKFLFAIALKFDLAKTYNFKGITKTEKIKAMGKLKIPVKIKVPVKIKAQKKIQRFKKVPKTPPKLKVIKKTKLPILKKPVVPKIKPGKPPRVPKKIKLPTFKTSLPRGSRVAVNIRIAGKIFAIKKPINIALQRATTIVLRDKKIKKFDLIIVGVTKAKDKLRPKALDKFKGTKGDRVYTYVQK